MDSKVYERDLIGFLRLHSEIDKDFLALIDGHLKEKLYYYGDHFRLKAARFPKISFFLNCAVTIIHNTLINFYYKTKQKPKQRVLSAASRGYDVWLEENLNFNVDRCNYSAQRFRTAMPGLKLTLEQMRISYILEFYDFNYLISDEFKRIVYDYKKKLRCGIVSTDYSLLLVAGDLVLTDRLFIEVFKELGLPTACMAHGGMPSIYDHLHETKTDFLTQFGQRQIEGFTDNGYDPKRFVKTGHPYYDKWPQKLRHGLDNILVCTKAADGVPSEDDKFQHNRSECLRYIYEIDKVLKELGVKKAKLRVHPSENPEWYAKYIDTKFFVLDRDDLSTSLSNATVVIGPVSTVFIDAIHFGVSYVVYEPQYGGHGIFGRQLVKPLDGSDAGIPLATSTQELKWFLKNNRSLDQKTINEFVGGTFELHSFASKFKKSRGFKA